MNDLTQQGVVALKSGNKIRARNLLKAALRQDPRDVDAWLWLSGAVETDAERIDCLENVLRLDPANRAAGRGYAQLTGREWAAAQQPATDIVPPPAMVPMGEGAPPVAMDQLSAAAPEISAPAEEPEVDESILREFPPEEAPAEETPGAVPAPVETSVEQITDVAPAAGEPDFVETPDEPVLAESHEEPPVVESVPEAPAAAEEPRIKSWEELLGPSEADEPLAAVEPAVEDEVTDTQEVRIGKPGSSLRFVTGPALGYGLIKMLLLLLLFTALAAAAYYYLANIPQLYIVYAAAGLAVIWLVIFLFMLLSSSSTRYTLTKDKLILERGFLDKSQTTLSLADIESVEPRRSVLQSLSGVGNILVKAKTEAQPQVLKDLAHFTERLEELKNAVQ